MKIIDTHCHPYMNSKKEQNAIINNFFDNGGVFMIVIGTDLKTSLEAINLAKNHEKIFATIGIHPCDIRKLDLEKTISELENLYLQNSEKIVAIGEIGLDYYRLERDFAEGKIIDLEIEKNLQKIFFKAQINLAKKLNLPIVIHNRESREDILEILKEMDFKNFIFHCFSENLDFAKRVLDFAPEAKISFSGTLTFKNALDIQQTAKNIPLKNILTETDSPFLTPVPFRGKEENEPIFTKYVLEKLAEVREEDFDFVSEEIYKNSVEFFRIR